MSALQASPVAPWLVEGRGATARLAEALAQLGVARPLLVHGAGSFARSGAAARVLPQLDGQALARFNGVVANPTAAAVDACARAATAHRADVLIAVGGGSVLDTAKGAAWALGCDADLATVVTKGMRRTRPLLPIVALPTTAGTGSEVTHFAAVYVDGVKHSVADVGLRPAVALCDPDLVDALFAVAGHAGPTARVALAAGLDCLTQALESLWSVASTEASRAHAVEALVLAYASLGPALAGDRAAAAAMMRAATRAGQAIDVSKTTACHALSYTMTSRFGLEHGFAVALTAPAVLRFNAGITDSDCVDPRGVAHVRAVLDLAHRGLVGTTSDAAAAPAALEAWMRGLGFEPRLSAHGMGGDDALLALAGSVNAERLGNNPRRMDDRAVLALLRRVR